jgi:outer membrane protein W
MKTFYLTTLLLSLGIAANAQTQKGTININGQFGSNSGGQHQVSQDGRVKSFSLQLNPNVGYFVKDNWEVGTGVLFGTTQGRYKSTIQGDLVKQSSNALGIQLYSKYYFGKGAVKPYITGGAGHNWLTQKTKTVNDEPYSYKTTNWNAGGGAGIAWFVSPKIGLFSQLTYDRTWNKNNSFGSLNLNFGVQVNLGKK